MSSCNTVTLLKNMQHLHHFPEFTQKICCFYDTSLIPHEPDLLPIIKSTFSLQTYSSLTTIFCSLLSYSKYDPSFYLLFIVNKSSHLHPQHCFIQFMVLRTASVTSRIVRTHSTSKHELRAFLTNGCSFIELFSFLDNQH